MYQRPQYYQYKKQRQRKEFLLPFLILICLGVIIALIIKLFLAFKTDTDTDLSKKISVYLYGDQNIQILPSGESVFVTAYSGSSLFKGDTLKTGAGTRAILSFNDGNIVRVAENSQIKIADISKKDENNLYSLITLNYGAIWMNKAGVYGDYVFQTDKSKVYSIGTRFSLENTVNEVLRVSEGNVQFDVIDNSSKKELTLESYVVGIGQELTLTNENYKVLQARKLVDLKKAISRDFEATDWYIWNTKEDEDPTIIPKLTNSNDKNISPAVVAPTEIPNSPSAVDASTLSMNPSTTATSETESSTVNDKQDPVLSIVKPSTNPYTLTAQTYTIQGTISGYATKVIVETVSGAGIKDVYTLSKFKAGDLSWSYIASNSLKNLSEGKNTYKIYAKNKDGKSSLPLQLVINVPVGSFPTDVVDDKENPNSGTDGGASTVSSTNPDSTSTTNVSANTNTGSSLSAPIIASFNGSSNTNNHYETTEDRVEIIGSVDSSTAKVYVNGFALSLYQSGSTTWKYYAKTAYNNLSLGENSYSVYAVDASGKKSATVSFVIVKK